jgi:predicted RNA methylase
LLPRELFAGKTVLDLGCNAGKLTLEVLNYLGATRARGVDIDAHLISQAEAAANGQQGIEFSCDDLMKEDYEFGEWDTVRSLSSLPTYRTDPFTPADHAAEHHEMAAPPSRR